MIFHSNIQSLVINKGKVERVSNQRQEHATRKEAYDRVKRATTVANKPKSPIYYANRQYTVAL